MFEREPQSYVIKSVSGEIDWDKIDKAPISIYCWRYDYKPTSFAQLVALDEKELVVRLTCYEKNPKAVYTKFGEDVWKDSCLEFFAAMDENEPNKYINCEMNSGGAALVGLGTFPGERGSAIDVTGNIPEYKAEVFEDKWQVTLHLKLEDMRKIFGEKVNFKKGFKFTGNLFKCGDETEYEHYGMWCRSIAVIPQFHRPEYFGDFIIG